MTKVVATCKRYAKAMNLQRSTTSGEQVIYNTVTNPADRVVCSYLKCGKGGHTQADCWKKKRDLQTAQLKRAGIFKISRDETWKIRVKKSVILDVTIAEHKITCRMIAVTENSSEVVQNLTKEQRRRSNTSNPNKVRSSRTGI